MFKTEMIWKLVIYGACVMLVSCQLTADQLQATPTRDPSIVTIATLQSYPTPINVFEYPEQVTDGILLFSIKSVSDECSRPSTPIQVKLSFKNLTGDTIILPSDFAIAANRRGDGGNLIPFITATDESDVFTPGDFQLVDIFNTPSTIYSKVPPHQNVDFLIQFTFPQYLAEQVSNKEAINLITPAPGQYYIRFVFLEYQRSNDIWNGAIGSNRLGICILK